MNTHAARQRGMVLVIGLIMLLLMTLMVSTAFTLSSVNLESVGNVQWRNNAEAAANVALEQVTSSAFTTAPQAQQISVDLNRDGTAEYTANVATPVCVKASLASSAAPSSITLIGMSNATWNTIWNLEATVNDALTGASVRVRSGVRILLSDSRKNLVCP